MNFLHFSCIVSLFHCPTSYLFQCSVCSKKFRSSGEVTLHKRADHENNKPHACQHCPLTFVTRSRLKVHELTHSGRKLIKCDQCDYGCNSKMALERHRVIHETDLEGRRTFICETCGAGFVNDKTLRRHIRTMHLGYKPYVCRACGKRFRGPSDGRGHRCTSVEEAGFVKVPLDNKRDNIDIQ